jgi:hypothetical protein
MASYRNLTFGDSVKHDQRKFKHLAPKTAGNYNGNNSNHHEYDKIGQKISGLERRKKENRNKRRRKKRIFNLTPAVPNMESIPEDDDEESEYIRMNFASGLTKSRRRDSVCSWNSANDSDNEQLIQSEDIDINNSKEVSRNHLPDYLCLGEEVDRMDDFYSHYAITNQN